MKQRKSKLNNKNLQDKLLEHFESIEAASEFWDTHDSGDYEEYMKDVECDVEIKRRTFLVALDGVMRRVG